MTKNDGRRVILVETLLIRIRAVDDAGELIAVSAGESHAIRCSGHVLKFGVRRQFGELRKGALLNTSSQNSGCTLPSHG